MYELFKIEVPLSQIFIEILENLSFHRYIIHIKM